MYDADTFEVYRDGEEFGTAMRSAVSADVIGTIELDLLKLVRHLETLGRHSSLYRQVDRAGYLALRTLDTLGPVSVNVLARELHLDASTVTRQVTTLEKGGFIERRRDPRDGRSSSIVLTTKGTTTMHRVELERRHRMETIVESWTDAERANLGSALSLLNASLIENVSSLDESND